MRSGTLTSAAEFLNTSQPGVSRLIKDLEAHVGFMLFTRHGSRIVPTQAAHDLWEVVERSFIGLDYISEMAGRIKSGTNTSLSIAASPVFAATLVADSIQEVASLHDLETINAIHITTLPVVRQIALRRAELGVTMLQHHSQDTDLIKSHSVALYAIGSGTEDFGDGNVVGIGVFEGRDFVGFDESTVSGQLQNGWFAAMRQAPNVTIKSYLANVVSAMVLKGFGLAIVDPWTACEHIRKGGRAVRFDHDYDFRVSYIKPLGAQLSKVGETLVDVMDANIQNIDQAVLNPN